MDRVLNISSYKFVPINDLPDLRDRLLDKTKSLGLKGTILIAKEGINLFLAGAADQIHGFVSWLGEDSRFADLAPKESWSEHQPFRKMLVKIKEEIIRMNHPTIRPHAGRAPAVTAETLNRWLDQGHDDEGRPVVTLDTRNAFEVDFGTFKNTIDYRINKFTEFPKAIAAHRDELKDKTIVSFCTGGIRCEKAAIYMREIGLEHTYQLEGGILKYFEETDAHHYDGGCFVFDERLALDPSLTPQKTESNTMSKDKMPLQSGS
jgi:UPF0176 protein